MQALEVHGGNALHGAVTIHGAKNSTLPVLAACVCANGQSVLENCPEIEDVETAVQMLRQLGCGVSGRRGTLQIDTETLTSSAVAPALAGRMRSSVLFLGALLARCGEAQIPLPGGCELGPRPVDLHIRSLRALGAEIAVCDGALHGRMPRGCGGEVTLPFPSVGATENVMLAAAGCTQPVTIHNAAREPEIVDLAQYLRTAGMEISGDGSTCITLARPRPLHGAKMAILPDRIEAATYLCAAAAARGSVTLQSVRPAQLLPVLEALRRAGCEIVCTEDTISLQCRELRGIGAVTTAPYPGFPTDAQPPLLAAMATAHGTTCVEETIFSARFRHAAALRQMGAQIRVEGQRAVVEGVPQLHGAAVTAQDLRGGAALLIAALAAQGVTRLSGLAHLRRGYAGLEENFQTLGATIKLLEIP